MARGDDKPVTTREAASFVGVDVKAVRKAAVEGKVERWGSKVKASSILDKLADTLGITECPLCGHGLDETHPPPQVEADTIPE